MDMLWLFYQITDELLSETTSDTYALPLHNAITLLDEMDEVYSLLDQYGIVKEYYANYIPPIIEEFIVCTEDDSILKRMLGERLNSIRTGFQEASQNPILLNRWIGIFRQTCSPKKYCDTYKNEIEQLVLTNSPDKNNLIYCTKNYYISLLHAGYSREYLDITTYKSFLLFFASHEEGSEEMKALYSCLGDNILLRSRVYNLRKSLKSGEKISEFLSIHEIRINWQLKRLYRIRNIATHLGYEASGLSIAVNHLHSYFDYMVNYMLCKSENGDIIIDMSTLVLEAKNDNKIHHEQLKSKEPLSAANYMKYLFGPDSRLIDYKFEY